MSVGLGVESGKYTLVQCNRRGAIWFDQGNGSTVRESYGHDSTPFTHILTDFDNFWVDTESPGHFFDEIWARTFQEVGMEGDLEQLTSLRWRV